MGWIKDTANAVKNDEALKDRVRKQLKEGEKYDKRSKDSKRK